MWDAFCWSHVTFFTSHVLMCIRCQRATEREIERWGEKGCFSDKPQQMSDFCVLWKLNMAFTLLSCFQMVPVERGWLSGPSEAGNLRMLMLGGQFYATPSLLSPGAWTWSPLPAPVSGPLPPSSSLPLARLTEPQSASSTFPISTLEQGLAWMSGLSGQVRCQVHVCGWGGG